MTVDELKKALNELGDAGLKGGLNLSEVVKAMEDVLYEWRPFAGAYEDGLRGLGTDGIE